MNKNEYLPENQINEDCAEPLIVNGIIRATCRKSKGHKGRHGADFTDGSSLKWSNKKRVEKS